MKGHPKFSFERLRGIIVKEFMQMRRDRLTFAMMLGIPLIQLTLFGYAINCDPRHLPAAVLLADQGAQRTNVTLRDEEQHLLRFRPRSEN
jgi:ABC-2 type transport system permease protein